MCEDKHLASRIRSGLLFLILILAPVQCLVELDFASCSTSYEKADNPPPLAALSSTINNQIADFSASGENYKGEKISINQNGGTVEVDGTKIYFVPWKHLFWAEKNVDAFFLVNVTSSNFHIAFLYLSSESTSFELGIFDYSSAAYQKVLYQGRCLVAKTHSAGRKVFVPKLSFTANSKIENRLFATGPDLFVTGNMGYLKENRSTLSLYALRNTISTRLEWNELWTLLTGNNGEYSFSIIYMNNQDSSKILLGHAVRLNDYYVPEQKQLKATWYMKGDSCQLSIDAPQEVRSYFIDGFQLQRGSGPKFTVTLSKGLHIAGVENSTVGVNGVRLGFSQWSSGNTTNPLVVDIRSDTELSTEYHKEFLLTIESQYVDTRIAGWYREGQTAIIPNPKPVTKGDIMYQFDGWSEGAMKDGNNTVVVVNGPKTIRANWKAFFKVTLSTEGLPDSTKVVYILNGRTLPSEVPRTAQDWIQEKTSVNFGIDLPEPNRMKESLFLGQWKNQHGTEIKSPIRLSGPEKLTAVFTNQKQSTQLSCKVLTTDLLNKGQLGIEGKITPPQETTIFIELRVTGEPWRILCKVPTDATGQYRYDWKPEVSGVLELRATWPGDTTRSAATSEPQGVGVSQSMLKFKTLAGTFQDTTSSIYEELKGPESYSETLRVPFMVGMGVVDTIYMRLANLRPLGPILAIIAGSALVGVFYVFPWLAVVLVLAVIVTKRSIKLKVTAPLLIILVLSSMYLILEEMNVTDLLHPPSYVLPALTAVLASVTGLLTALLPSLGIANSLVKRWKHPQPSTT